jgi:FAD:protein FMN transferase
MFESDTPMLRRCRPWLGTLVEITARGLAPAALVDAIEAAYSQIAMVHHSMSLHDAASELSMLNARAFHEHVSVSPLLGTVLMRALKFARLSGGAFDMTQRQSRGTGVLRAVNESAATFEAVSIAADVVRFQRDVQLDLNGIAKGFAVDLAVERLQAAGVSAGLVNAGGDLRCFGDCDWAVHTRCAATGALHATPIRLRNQAAASSGGQLHWRMDKEKRRMLPTLHSNRGRYFGTRSVTVIAPNAMDCDALTKVALLGASGRAGQGACVDGVQALMTQFDAQAMYFH